jgi:hypothetical protein
MIDVSKGRVRVSPSRLKQLKDAISELDRRIQLIQRKLYWLRNYSELDTVKKELINQRYTLDVMRKQLRLKIKGYIE